MAEAEFKADAWHLCAFPRDEEDTGFVLQGEKAILGPGRSLGKEQPAEGR